MQTDYKASLIVGAVKQAGDLFLAEYKQAPIAPELKTLFEQLATIDKRCLTVLKDRLTPAFPQIPWLVGDEFDSASQKQPLDLPEYWLCDAMDGAIQYLQHLPGWTINLVLIRAERPQLSVIYAPLEGELFWASEGAGAFLNGKPIKPSMKTDADVMLAVFEYGHQDKTYPTPQLNQQIGSAVTKLLDTFGVVRNYGPHGLQLAQVGNGRIDLFHQLGLDTFNWLAGLLIAKEAGAVILTTDGRPWTWGEDSLLVASPNAAQRFLSPTLIATAS